jgi:hypothetical protein
MEDKATWKIQIDDGYCKYEYTIEGDSGASIYSIATCVKEILKSDTDLVVNQKLIEGWADRNKK